MRRVRPSAHRQAGILLGLAPLALAIAQAPAPPSSETEELLARERVRSAVEALFEGYAQPAADGDERVEMAIRTAQGFVALGPETLPYLVNELEQEALGTYDLCVYALGLMGTPAAREALRVAVARADETPGARGESLKSWSAWALGLAGDAEALRLMVMGQHQVALHPVHGLMTALESVAIQTAPASVPLLLELLDDRAHDEASWQVRDEILHALRRVGDPAAAPLVITLLGHSDRNARREAAWTLSTLATPESLAALAGALGDDDFTVRRAAAMALERIGAAGHEERIRERSEVESDVVTRGALYRWLADTGGPGALPWLAARVPHEDGRGRRLLAEAAALREEPGAVAFLAGLLHDEDNGVALQAALSLGDLGGDDAARAMIAALPSVRPLIASAAAEQLVRRGATEAGAPIAARVLRELDAPAPLDRNTEIGLQKLAEALPALGHGAAGRELATTLERRAADLEPGLLSALRGVVAQLGELRSRGRKVERWSEAVAAPDPSLRRLALAQLGQIGSLEAVRALERAFETAERDDRLAILLALGGVPASRARGLIERALLDEAFDPPREAEVRAAAAWSARRIGGEEMAALLAASARRRDGRDAKVLVYAALLDGPSALPLLAELRRPRLRYLGWSRGQEQERLDWLAARLADGRAVSRVDLPPAMLGFR